MTSKKTRIALVVALVALGGMFVLPAQAATPRGIHVSLGADAARTATIAWFTDGLDDPGTTVSYGPTEALGSLATGTTVQATGVTVLTHEVSLKDLAPGARVYYRVWGDDEIRSFHTSPLGRAPFRFTVFSDHGRQPQSQTTTGLAMAEQPDLHLMAGDLSYANSDFPDWDTWFDQIQPFASTVPLMPAPGNHEYETGGTGSFRTRFALPGAEQYYSFDYANVHFLVLTSDRATATGEAIAASQIAFAENDLRDAFLRKSQGLIDFTVVVQHHPLYANMEGGVVDGMLERQANPYLISWEEPLLHRYQVDLVIAGHNHHYERLKPMAAGHPTQGGARDYQAPTGGFIEVITGGGGQSLYSFRDPNDFWPASAARAKRFHFLRFDVNGKTMSMTALASDGDDPRVIDTFTLRAA